jgi:hypothetical protein
MEVSGKNPQTGGFSLNLKVKNGIFHPVWSRSFWRVTLTSDSPGPSLTEVLPDFFQVGKVERVWKATVP